MPRITGKDVWYGYNQPYGYWKVGNPIVKVSVLALVILGTFAQDPSLTFQGLAAIFIMLYAPSDPNSRYQNLFIIASLYLVPYDSLRLTTTIPTIATIDWFSIMTVLIVFYAFFKVAVAATTRDFAWFIDLMPKSLHMQVGGLMYSYAYSIPRILNMMREADEAIRSRGGYSPFALSTLRSLNRFIDTIGVWSLNIMRQMEEMAVTIDYTIVSRIVMGKRGKTPIVRKWSKTDYTMAGVLVFGVIVSRMAVGIASLI